MTLTQEERDDLGRELLRAVHHDQHFPMIGHKCIDLIARGANLEMRDYRGETPLMKLAGNYGRDVDRVIRALLDTGADLEAAHPETGDRPLMIAVQKKCCGNVEKLLAAKADPHAANKKGVTVLELAKSIAAHDRSAGAAVLKHVEEALEKPFSPPARIIRKTISQGFNATPEKDEKSAITEALVAELSKPKAETNIEKCLQLIDDGADPNALGQHRNPPFCTSP